jgi:hypothetical protein
MYYLLIRRFANGYTIHSHAFAYETREQLDRAYESLRQRYVAPVTLTKLREITEDSPAQHIHEAGQQFITTSN